MRALFSNVNPAFSLVSLILLALWGALFFGIAGGLITYWLTDAASLSAAMAFNYKSEQGLMGIRILQSSQTIGIFIFPAVALAYLSSSRPWGFLGFKKVSWRLLMLSALFILISLPGINLLASLNALIPVAEWMINMERVAMEITQALLKTQSFTLLLANLLIVAVLPALGEELFFRGIIQPYFCKMVRSTFGGILLASAVFSAIHMQFHGFLPRMALGVMFGYLYVWSGSLWVPIVVHFVNNATATILYYFIGVSKLPSSIETLGDLKGEWVIGVASIAAASVFAWFIRNDATGTLLRETNQARSV